MLHDGSGRTCPGGRGSKRGGAEEPPAAGAAAHGAGGGLTVSSRGTVVPLAFSWTSTSIFQRPATEKSRPLPVQLPSSARSQRDGDRRHGRTRRQRAPHAHVRRRRQRVAGVVVIDPELVVVATGHSGRERELHADGGRVVVPRGGDPGGRHAGGGCRAGRSGRREPAQHGRRRQDAERHAELAARVQTEAPLRGVAAVAAQRRHPEEVVERAEAHETGHERDLHDQGDPVAGVDERAHRAHLDQGAGEPGGEHDDEGRGRDAGEHGDGRDALLVVTAAQTEQQPEQPADPDADRGHVHPLHDDVERPRRRR